MLVRGKKTSEENGEGKENLVVCREQWWAPAPASRFRTAHLRTAHLRTVWIPVSHHTHSHRAPELRFRTINFARLHRIIFLW